MSEKIKCLIDNTEYDSIESFHMHLRRFKIKQKDYYEEYYPRKDISNGKKIEYKNYDQYFSQEFIDKNSLKRYLKDHPEEGKTWSINYLKKRKESKGLMYSMSQAELRSLFTPSIKYFESVGKYNNICEDLGYVNRYDYAENNLKYQKLDNPTIIVDSREQTSLKLAVPTEVLGLKVGDYALKNNPNNIVVERKSGSDFINTLSGGYERFRREFERAKKLDTYVVILVEENINSMLNFNYLPHLKYSKATPDFIFKRLRDLLNEFPLNVQCLFVDGRIDASKILIRLFQLGENLKKIDLQYFYEEGKL